MNSIPRELLLAYLDDALSETETAHVERALRQSEALRKQFAAIVQEHDRGEHSVAAVWRRERLTCATREQLGSYLLGVLEPGLQDYLTFHLQSIGCPFCRANLDDLKARQAEAPQTQRRRKRYFDSSAGLLRRK